MCTNATQGVAGCADRDIVSQTVSSFTVGGQVGYRYQWRNLVVGAEGMIDLFAASVTTPAVAPVPNRVRTTRFDALYSATGQVGYAMGSLLFYGKGGWAGTGIQFDANNLNLGPGIPADLSASQNVSGYTAGAGLEWLILPNFSVGVEYDYYNFNVGSLNGLANSGGAVVACAFCNVSEKVQTVLARVNLMFPTP